MTDRAEYCHEHPGLGCWRCLEDSDGQCGGTVECCRHQEHDITGEENNDERTAAL